MQIVLEEWDWRSVVALYDIVFQLQKLKNQFHSFKKHIEA